ncbi:hypothetical protein C1645_829459 [Glomus cerebriforme]|uniref:BTB domain-containing protein n=1 Tax=Glomus cerebriforme TaxID=658196 RepID=A0A397STV2_9GLOM|nr:hypothetical protein C1645_829459 [Glomus cerebriforme]
MAIKRFHAKLLQDISSMYSTSTDYNVIIQVGTNQNIKEFRAHSNILRARSKYFKAALSNEWSTEDNNSILFKKPNINPNVFKLILKYIYSGEMQLSKQSGADVLELLAASDELLFSELFPFIQDHIIRFKSDWIEHNLILVLNRISKTVNDYKNLRDRCIKFVLADPLSFVISKDFPLLDKDILYELFEREDFLIEETIIWDCLIKWGIEQTPGLGSDNSDRFKWNNENYEGLKETLNHFIPLIRFSEISSADFFDKVRPYKAVIPTNIYEEAMEFHMKGTLSEITTIFLPARVGIIPIESRIIKPKLAYIISNWIDKKNAKAVRNKNNLRYRFNLLYRSSRDGLDINTIHSKCSEQNTYLILIKQQSPVQNKTSQNIDLNAVSQEEPLQNLTKIYGEYSTHTAKVGQCINTTENFIFSFENDNDIKNMKISRMNHIPENKINVGTVFHLDCSRIHVKTWGYCNNNIISADTNFVPAEFEVFRVY